MILFGNLHRDALVRPPFLLARIGRRGFGGRVPRFILSSDTRKKPRGQRDSRAQAQRAPPTAALRRARGLLICCRLSVAHSFSIGCHHAPKTFFSLSEWAWLSTQDTKVGRPHTHTYTRKHPTATRRVHVSPVHRPPEYQQGVASVGTGRSGRHPQLPLVHRGEDRRQPVVLSAPGRRRRVSQPVQGRARRRSTRQAVLRQRRAGHRASRRATRSGLHLSRRGRVQATPQCRRLPGHPAQVLDLLWHLRRGALPGSRRGRGRVRAPRPPVRATLVRQRRPVGAGPHAQGARDRGADRGRRGCVVPRRQHDRGRRRQAQCRVARALQGPQVYPVQARHRGL